MWTNNAEGDAIEIIECADDTREGEFVAKEISSIADSGEEWRNIAVFYRNNAQSRIIEDHLIRKGIPYRVVAGHQVLRTQRDQRHARLHAINGKPQRFFGLEPNHQYPNAGNRSDNFAQT